MLLSITMSPLQSDTFYQLFYLERDGCFPHLSFPLIWDQSTCHQVVNFHCYLYRSNSIVTWIGKRRWTCDQCKAYYIGLDFSKIADLKRESFVMHEPNEPSKYLICEPLCRGFCSSRDSSLYLELLKSAIIIIFAPRVLRAGKCPTGALFATLGLDSCRALPNSLDYYAWLE